MLSLLNGRGGAGRGGSLGAAAAIVKLGHAAAAAARDAPYSHTAFPDLDVHLRMDSCQSSDN